MAISAHPKEAFFWILTFHTASFDTGNSTTQIIPIIIGGETETMALADKLANEGFLATAIRPPTVPAGKSRIRIALSSAHSVKQIDGLLSVFESWHGEA